MLQKVPPRKERKLSDGAADSHKTTAQDLSIALQYSDSDTTSYKIVLNPVGAAAPCSGIAII